MALSIRGLTHLLVRTPTALFPIALGLVGLGSALRIANDALPLGVLLPTALSLVCAGGIILAASTVLYTIKLVQARGAVIEDLSITTRANLLAPGFMAAMVIGGALYPSVPFMGLLWLIATLGHFALLIWFVGGWLTHDHTPEELNPTWFLPAAGIMTSAMSWPSYGPIEIPVFMLSTGGILWAMLLPLVFRRLVFEAAISPQLRPTLFIIAAPFGLVAGAIMTLFPHISYGVPGLFLLGGSFFIIVPASKLQFLSRSGITLSWWATTFPVATVAAGFLRVSINGADKALYIGMALLIIACITTSFAILATMRATWCTCVKTVGRTEEQIAAMQGIK